MQVGTRLETRQLYVFWVHGEPIPVPFSLMKQTFSKLKRQFIA